MSWSEHHRQSEALASQAFLCKARGEPDEAIRLYADAAAAEQKALSELEATKTRTFGITAVSAVSLWFKAAAYERAEELAYQVLNDPRLPEFGKHEIRLIVQSIWTEYSKKEAGVSFLPGQVTVSIKGGQVLTGGAPLDLIVEKTQTIQSIFYRSIELEQKLPFRSKGAPPKSIVDSCRPWLFQAPPGSYQFAIAIQNDPQADFFRSAPDPAALATKFLSILRASAEEGQLEKAVPDPDYRATFLKLARNLAPTGKAFASIEFRSEDEVLKPVILTPESRVIINRAINPPRISDDTSQRTGRTVTKHGVLRALNLEKDWLEVIDGKGSIVRVVGVKDTVDDVIGPMVNKRVSVHVTETKKGQLKFADIELEE